MIVIEGERPFTKGVYFIFASTLTNITVPDLRAVTFLPNRWGRAVAFAGVLVEVVWALPSLLFILHDGLG
jgi:hypothetical protein